MSLASEVAEFVFDMIGLAWDYAKAHKDDDHQGMTSATIAMIDRVNDEAMRIKLEHAKGSIT